MNTLSNVYTRGGEEIPPSTRVAPDVLPEAKSSRTGVSVEYTPSVDKEWFVFRASYGREDKASDYLIEDGTYTYVAKRYVDKIVLGKRKRVLEPLVPNLIFVYTTKEKAETYVRRTPILSYLSYYYNHFEQDDNGKNPPLTIPEGEMLNFVRATVNRNEHLLFVDPAKCHYKGGEQVRVIAGLFEGVKGRVARVCGQQRVIVSLYGIGLVSTAYIPTAFIEIVKGEE